MRSFWNYAGPGQLMFGRGAVQQLGRTLARRGLRRPLLITDPNLVAAGAASTVRRALEQAGLSPAVFDGGTPEPTVETAEQAAQAARDARPDVIVGLGGGSNMDLAKVTATLHAFGGAPADYFGFDRIPGPVTPVVCIPTTAGTGSEVSHSAVLTDPAARVKVSTLSPHLRPCLALVDPLLTLSCPPRATADSGIDALTHAIEACTAMDYDRVDVSPDQPTAYSGRTPMGDMLAEKAIRLIGRHLVTAVRDPACVDAREGMALAATLAGLAFSNCAVAVVHALEYPIGGALHVSHGAGNGLLLPFVMRFNLPVRARELGAIGRWLGVAANDSTEVHAAEAAIQGVERLKQEVGIPTRLRDIGATREQLPDFAAKSHAIQRLMILNPRLPSVADLLGILQAAY